ncbi:DNA repair protein RecO, partial [Desulfobacterales bacterium HSG2]|nr:DNA repair protein RecO [Desulfobacterales bacterium HSG2]
MNTFSTSAIMLRRIDFGDYDLIITFLTLDMGKVSVIAKSAKRSKKRFAGILELFSVLQVVCSRGRGLPVLQEAVLRDPFIKIRSDIK